MVDLAAVYAKNIEFFGSIPDRTTDVVCAACLGPVQPDFTLCYACSRLFAMAPDELRERIVPLTSALSPSPWYTRLLTYKRGNSHYAWTLIALLERYLAAHADDIATALGGPPAFATVVPSKQPGVTFETQTLARVLRAVPDLPWPIEEALSFHAGASVPRRTYTPEAFEVLANVQGRRVLLIEDSWVSGATPLSAAGALRAAGAEVLLLPIARVIDNPGWWGEHPYLTMMREPYDVARWPR